MWAEIKSAAAWLRDEAGAFIASFWMIASLYAIGGWLLWVWSRVDAEFSRPLAGGIIPAEVTQHFSWTILAFSVVVGMAASWCHYRDLHREKRIFVALGIVAAVILLFHAWGLSAKIMEQQYARSAVIADVAETRTGTNDTQITAIEEQIASLRLDRDADVAALEQALDAEVNDGNIRNDDAAREFYGPQIADVRARYASRIEALEERKLSLVADSGIVTVEAQTEDANTLAFNPLFTLAARATTGKWNPAETPSFTHQYVWGFAFFFIFWGFGKLLMMTLFTLAFGMQQKAAADARMKREGRPAGMTDEEWSSYQEFQRRSEAARRGHDTRAREARRSGKFLSDWPGDETIARALEYCDKPHMAAGGIARAVFGCDLENLRERTERWIKGGKITRETAERILLKQRTGAPVRQPDPRAPVSNGHDTSPAITKDEVDADDHAGNRPDQGV